MMSEAEPGKLRELDTLEGSSKDMKSLQAFVDMSNLETLDAMTHVVSGLRVRHSSPSPTQVDSLLRSLVTIRQQHRMGIKNFSSMIERANSLSEHVRFLHPGMVQLLTDFPSFETSSRFVIVWQRSSSR